MCQLCRYAPPVWARTPECQSTAWLHQSTLGAGPERTWHSWAPQPRTRVSGAQEPHHQVVSHHGNTQRVVIVACQISHQWKSVYKVKCWLNVMSKYDRWIVIRGMSVVIWKLCLQCSVMFGLLELHYAELIVCEFWIRRSLPPSDLFE